jgi:hypothetical protein
VVVLLARFAGAPPEPVAAATPLGGPSCAAET